MSDIARVELPFFCLCISKLKIEPQKLKVLFHDLKNDCVIMTCARIIKCPYSECDMMYKDKNLQYGMRLGHLSWIRQVAL